MQTRKLSKTGVPCEVNVKRMILRIRLTLCLMAFQTFHLPVIKNLWDWLNLSHTCAKLTLSHSVPLVNALKEAVPSSAPEGMPRNETQLTIMDPLESRPDSNTQTRKLFCVTSEVHKTAESWTLGDFVPWLIDAWTRIFPGLENTWGYCTVVQCSKSGDATVKLTFPCWKRFCAGMKIIKEIVKEQLTRVKILLKNFRIT